MEIAGDRAHELRVVGDAAGGIQARRGATVNSTRSVIVINGRRPMISINDAVVENRIFAAATGIEGGGVIPNCAIVSTESIDAATANRHIVHDPAVREATIVSAPARRLIGHVATQQAINQDALRSAATPHLGKFQPIVISFRGITDQLAVVKRVQAGGAAAGGAPISGQGAVPRRALIGGAPAGRQNVIIDALSVAFQRATMEGARGGTAAQSGIARLQRAIGQGAGVGTPALRGMIIIKEAIGNAGATDAPAIIPVTVGDGAIVEAAAIHSRAIVSSGPADHAVGDHDSRLRPDSAAIFVEC